MTDLLAVLDRDPEDWPAEMFPVADDEATSRDDSPGCDTTAPLASDHPSGPGLDSFMPLPEPDDEAAWTAMLFGDPARQPRAGARS